MVPQVTAQLEEVRVEVSAALGRLGRIDEDNLTLLEKLNALDSRLVGLDSRDGQLEGRLGQAASELEARIAVLDAEGGRAREKLQQLEDAYTIQVTVMTCTMFSFNVHSWKANYSYDSIRCPWFQSICCPC